VKFKEKS